MIVTILVAWLSSQSEHFDPWMLFVGTVFIDLAIADILITVVQNT